MLKRAAIKWIGTPAQVVAIKDLSPEIRSIEIQSPQIKKIGYQPGDKVKLSIANVLRSYTPSLVDLEKGGMELIFHLHGGGPAAIWAQELVPGEELSFMGPARSVKAEAPEIDWALFFGDETTIGLAKVVHHTLAPQVSLKGAIEVNPGNEEALSNAGLAISGVSRQAKRGQALIDAVTGFRPPSSRGLIWLSGEADSVLGLRNYLLDNGFERSQLRIKPYWSQGGKKRRKEVEKEMA